MAEDGRILVGITDYAQKKLKSIEYLNLSDEGDNVVKGASFGEVESQKSVSEMMAPVSGTISEINEEAVNDPGLLNRDPYGAGWIMAFTCNNFEAQIADLMNSETYEAYIESRARK